MLQLACGCGCNNSCNFNNFDNMFDGFSVLFFVGTGCVGVFPSHLGVVGVVCFLVWAVFLFVLGWGKRFFCPIGYVELCWVGWDEDGEVCCALLFLCLGLIKKTATLR